MVAAARDLPVGRRLADTDLKLAEIARKDLPTGYLTKISDGAGLVLRVDGREVALTKVVTTVGKPGVQVASITKRPGGYVFAHVEGAARPLVNGQAVAADPVHLKSGDLIELAGTQMQFVQA